MSTVTGLILKSYMTIARLMGFVDKKRKQISGMKLPDTLPESQKETSVEQAWSTRL